MPTTTAVADHLKTQLRADIAALAETLPKLAPLHRLTPENPLQGVMEEDFSVALAQLQSAGIRGYQSETQFRDYFRQYRINKADLAAAMDCFPELNAKAALFGEDDAALLRYDLYYTALLYDIEPLTWPELYWQLNENRALDALPKDLPASARRQLMAGNASERTICRQLWQIIEDKLGLAVGFPFTPKATPTPADNSPALFDYARQQLASELAAIGITHTLPGFIGKLTGIDLMGSILAQLNRICASALIEGIAARHLPGRSELGLYGAWRQIARFDADPFLYELPDWQAIMTALPDQALDAVILQLRHLEIPQPNWPGYLRMLALDSLGWASYIHWHQAGGSADCTIPVTLADLLAIRLTLERLWLNQACRETWLIEGKLSRLQAYFGKNPAEFVVRRKLFQGDLPEHCTGQAEILTTLSGSARHDAGQWQQLALEILALEWASIGTPQLPNAADQGWRLFRLCQYWGLNAEAVSRLEPARLTGALDLLNGFSPHMRSRIWLQAYENHYRDGLLSAIREQWFKQRLILKPRLEAQVIFCVDIREEGIRRHLEALNPAVDTCGARGFPKLEITAQARKQTLPPLLAKLDLSLYRDTLAALPGIILSSPFYVLRLLGQFTAPRHWQAFARSLGRQGRRNRTVAFNLQSAISRKDVEQLAGFFQALGLTENFAGLVVLVGHRSTSSNPLYRQAYHCAVCANAHTDGMRQLAGLLNRPEVRGKLAEHGVSVPPDVWFTAVTHDTCRDTLSWHDSALVPSGQQAVFERLQQHFSEAAGRNALERYHQLTASPGKLNAGEALIHMLERSADFSQAQPESGHAGLAAVIIGRRRLTKAIDLSRRAALVSYDAVSDTDGLTLSGHFSALETAILPISLGLYFSVTSPERMGSGPVADLNPLGADAMISGSNGDLHLGLPREIAAGHEAMRLLVVVEGDPALVQALLAGHERLHRWLNGRWLHLIVVAPFSGEISCWLPGSGFTPWQPAPMTMPDSAMADSVPPERPPHNAVDAA